MYENCKLDVPKGLNYKEEMHRRKNAIKRLGKKIHFLKQEQHLLDIYFLISYPSENFSKGNSPYLQKKVSMHFLISYVETRLLYI